ncbi:MAG: hypothetical protein OEX04_14160 [Acidimicrobiia bacterium]|nr:hypothetical protein [Acidimicrobiia bacterium]MDH4308610.1 hypothetical protein [Acidimicrobiia bacterium]MDH5292218.1 hypothetical protein [Acidimicrobiia bacterium]
MRFVVWAAVALATAVPTAPTWHFSGEDVPVAVLSPDAPPDRDLGDVDADGSPGRTLLPGDRQEFVLEHDGLDLRGIPVVEVWTASEGFGHAEPGSMRVGLYRCEAAICQELSSRVVARDPWSRDGGWVSRSVSLPAIEVELPAGELLCVRIEAIGARPIQLAYGTAAFPAGISVIGRVPPLPDAPVPDVPDDVTPEEIVESRNDLTVRPGVLGFRPAVSGFGALVGPLLTAVIGGSLLAALAVAASMASRRRALRTRTPPGPQVRP